MSKSNKRYVSKKTQKKQKEVKEENEDTELPYHKRWYQKNKESHLAYQAERIECDCGEMVRRNLLRRHQRTKIHARWMEEIEQAKQKVKEQKYAQYYSDKDLVKCLCDKYIHRKYIQEHLKSKFHSHELEKKLRSGKGHVYDYCAKYDPETGDFYMD